MATDLKAKLTLEAQAQGTDQLEQVADMLRLLADSAGDAAPRMNALADEFDAIAGDQRLINTLQNAAASSEQLGDAAGVQADAWKLASAAMQDAGLNADDLAASQDQVNLRLAAAGQTLVDVADEYGELGKAAEKSGDDAKDAFDGAGDGAEDLQNKLSGVTKAVAGLFAASKIKAFAADAIKTADAFGQMAARVQMATDSQDEFERVQARLLETSNIVARSLAEQQELYIRSAEVLKDYGKGADEILDITDGFTFLLDRNAASADKAQAAINAYSKALQTGRIDSLAWQTILSAMPSVVDDLAEATGKSGDEIRKMAIEGKLAVEDLTRAFEDSVEKNKAAAEAMPETLEGAMNRLHNTWGEFLRVANESSGATEKLIGAVDLLTNNLDILVPVATTAGAAITAMFAARALKAVASYGVAIAEATVRTVAFGNSQKAAAAAVAQTTTSVRVLGRTAATSLVFAAAITETLKLVDALRQLRTARARLADAEASAAKTNARAEQMLKRIQEQTGLAFTTLKDAIAAQERGIIVQNELTGEWELGANAAAKMADALQQQKIDAAQFRAAVDAIKDVATAAEDAEARIKAVAEAANITDVDGIKQLKFALRELRDDGVLSADDVRDAWRATIDAMDASAMREFSAALEQGFRAGAVNAMELAEINRVVLAASFDRLGVSASQALDQVGDATIDAVNALQSLEIALENTGANAEQAGRALEMALANAIPDADSFAALDALEGNLNRMAASGRLGADSIDRLRAQLEKQRGVIEDQLPGIQSLEEAYRKLGVTSQAELQRAADEARAAYEFVRRDVAATTEMIRASWAKMAEASIAANGGIADSYVKSTAAANGYILTVDETGKTVLKSVEAQEKALDDLAVKWRQAGESAAGAADDAADVADATEAAGEAADEAAEAHENMGETIRGTWLSAEASASKYSREAAQFAWDLEGQLKVANQALIMNWQQLWNVQADHVAKLRQAADEYIESMERLDRLQASLSASNSSAAQGVENLRMKLLELTGTEAQIADARRARDRAEVERQKAALQIEIQRAQLRGDNAEVQRLSEENRLLDEQLELLRKIHAAEKTTRNRPDTRSGSGDDRSSNGGSGGAARGGDVSITLNANGINDPVQLARMIEPELKRLQRLAR